MSAEERLGRARVSLEGLAVGDALGGYFEFAHGALPARIRMRQVPQPEWHWTDDTQMAAAVYAILRQYGRIEQDALALSFAQRYERARGYGPTTRAILSRIRKGSAWQDEVRSVRGGEGSFGNGGAMRAAPIGAFWADDMPQVVAQAAAAAEVTHAHPEGMAGAMAVAVAAACAWQAREAPSLGPHGLINHVLPWLPASRVREVLERALELDEAAPIAEVVGALGNGSRVTAMDTVPYALWCAGRHLGDYEAAIWSTLEGLGDSDTTCAMVGGIVACATGLAGIPGAWLAAREPLPGWAFAEG